MKTGSMALLVFACILNGVLLGKVCKHIHGWGTNVHHELRAIRQELQARPLGKGSVSR